jgi:membrane protease YdiL (CAAX protease family)
MTRTHSLTIYVAAAFGFSWLLGGVLFMLGPGAHIATRTLLMVLYMLGPAIGAVVAQRAAGESAFTPLGVGFKINRWWVVAWLLPFALEPLTMGCALLLPGVSFSPDMTGYFDRLAATMPPDRIAEARKELDGIPRAARWALIFVQPLVAGISINAIAAFGEELGWRGFMFRYLGAFGFWQRSAVVGLLWGVWHAPLILQGHNYPQHPAMGVFLMIAFCMLVAPLHDLVRLRGRSVWAAAVLHGTINASAGLSILFVRGGNDLLVGMTGLAGLLVLALVNAMLVVADRSRGGALTRRGAAPFCG